MKSEGIEVIAGVNLPMLIKLVSVRGKVPLEDAVVHQQLEKMRFPCQHSGLEGQDGALADP